MKQFIIFAGLVLLFAACSTDNDVVENNSNDQSNQLVPVRVNLSGFTVSQEDFSPTRAAQDVADYSGVNAVTLAFYNGTTEVYKSTQAKGDTGFGTFSLSLPMGSYTMVAVAYQTNEDNPFTLTSPTVAAYTGLHAFDTFVKTQTVNITNNSAVDISATLSRIVSMLSVISTDGKTADVSNVRMTLSAGGRDFNPSTGLAITNTGFANTVGVSAAVGATSTSSTALFLTADEQTMNVTIETLDADGAVLFSKTVSNVPFKRNRITKLTGAMYTNSGVSGSFRVETAWLTDQNGTF